MYCNYHIRNITLSINTTNKVSVQKLYEDFKESSLPTAILVYLKYVFVNALQFQVIPNNSRF